MSKREMKKELSQWGPVDGKILYTSFWFRPIVRLIKRRWQVAWAKWTGVFESKHRMTFYYNAVDMSAQGAKTIESWIKPPARRERLWREYKKMQKSLRRSSQEVKKLINKKEPQSRGTLRKSGSLWHECMMDMWSIGVVPEVANYGAVDYLWKKIKSFIPENHKHEVLEALLAPQWLSFHQQNEKELLKIAIEASSKEELKRRAESHAKKWYWVNNSYYECQNLSFDDFLKTLKGLSRNKILKRYAAINNYPETIKRRKRKTVKRWGLSSSIFQLANALSFSIWWQDHRKGLSWWADSIVDMLSRAAARKFNIEFNSIMMYTSEEWRNLLVSGVTVSPLVIQKREKLAVFYFSGNKIIEYTGRKAQIFVQGIQARILKPEIRKAKDISGIGVSRGIVRGIVYILTSPRYFSRMKRGGILVAPMTSPDYIIAMRKANGVITDVGGLTSHAAIISRELRIPCIVGTKIATKILKDGDLIEVNANEGIVKILKKKNEIYQRL